MACAVSLPAANSSSMPSRACWPKRPAMYSREPRLHVRHDDLGLVGRANEAAMSSATGRNLSSFMAANTGGDVPARQRPVLHSSYTETPSLNQRGTR